MVHSSISLLQERFKQLQRVKELREKRELLKMLSNTRETKHFSFDSSSSIMSHEPVTRLFFHPELINMNTSGSISPPPHVCLSLWPTTSQGVKDDNNTSSSSSTETQDVQASWDNVCDSGVDTSLHL
ncbi:uncharacterized protein LOC131645251 [Vicia villosa]|uniref:uncharacterized protein LOC131645251 n=1 Tax=Vicia villosa TaxID=3911 RepID=UPI00273C6CF0|nr:uncharacterized protein LOC131645251 [Vicia villosa]